MLVNFHMCGIILLLRAVLSMLVINASTRGPMCFRCGCYFVVECYRSVEYGWKYSVG